MKKIFKANIFQVKHIVDTEGKMRTRDFFIRKGLNVDDLFSLNELYKKMPIEWKNKRTCLGSGDTRHDNIDLANINFNINKRVYSFVSVSSKMVYNIFINTIQDSFAFRHPEVSALNLNKSEVATCFSVPRVSTLDWKLREFQYKLLHSIVFCNDKLKQFGIIQSNTCSFCRKEIETYHHIFYECAAVSKIWIEIGKKLNFLKFLNIQWLEVLIGVRDNIKHNALLNHVIILVKYMIYNNRKLGRVPTCKEICSAIKTSKQIEYEKAKRKDKLTLHHTKWEKFSLS